MAYSDGLMIFGSELAAKQVEDSAADFDDYVVPCNVTVLQFGVLITEDFTAHNTTDPVASLVTKTAIGGSDTNRIDLTLGSSNTRSLKSGDGVKVGQTALAADTDLDNGDIVLARPDALPLTLKQGEVLTLRHETAADGAGGAYIPFVIVRLDGQVDARATNVWIETA